MGATPGEPQARCSTGQVAAEGTHGRHLRAEAERLNQQRFLGHSATVNTSRQRQNEREARARGPWLGPRPGPVASSGPVTSSLSLMLVFRHAPILELSRQLQIF